VLRETSVLGLRLAGRGRVGGAFLTVVMEGGDEDVMNREICCLDWRREVGEDEAASPGGIYREIQVGLPWPCRKYRTNMAR
jgi:hypothetical protein